MSFVLNISAWQSFCFQQLMRRVVLFLVVVCAICHNAFWVTPSWGEQSLIILHTSEHHGSALPFKDRKGAIIGGLARRATLIRNIRSEGKPVLVVDSGDILVGTVLSSFFRGEPDVKAMNLIGYHAMTAGNHDFDFGVAHLRKLQKWADFPILCTTLTARSVQLPCRRATVVQVGDLRVGLMGVVGKSSFPDTFNREVAKALELQDPIETVRDQARIWKEDEKVDVVVVITHQHNDEDLALLAQVRELDVIVGGHTEGFEGLLSPGREKPIEELINPGRVFVKAHRQGRSLGRLDILIDNGALLWARAFNIPVTSDIEPDETVQRLLDDYSGELASYASKIVGKALVDLNGERSHIRTQETNLGNLLADLLRKEYRAQIALLNSGQARGSIPAGPVTLGKVFSILPFNSSVVMLEVTGQQLLMALENSVSLLPRYAGRFLQVSGLQVAYDITAPVGSRVRKLEINNHSFNLKQIYSVATDSFLAGGGDGYTIFQEATLLMDYQTPVRDLLLKALQKGPLKAEREGRIRFQGPSSPPQESHP